MADETFHGMTVADCQAVCGELSEQIDATLAGMENAELAQALAGVERLEAWLKQRVPGPAYQSWLCVLDAVLDSPKHHKAAVVTAFHAQAQIEFSVPRLRNRALEPLTRRQQRMAPTFKVEDQES